MSMTTGSAVKIRISTPGIVTASRAPTNVSAPAQQAAPQEYLANAVILARADVLAGQRRHRHADGHRGHERQLVHARRGPERGRRVLPESVDDAHDEHHALTDTSDCWIADGNPMRMVVHCVAASSWRNPIRGATGLPRARSVATSDASAPAWAISVAHAVPLSPQLRRSQPAEHQHRVEHGG